MTATALITGITGQDGSYLAELLLEKGYRVVGMTRRSSTASDERIAHLRDRIEIVQGDLLDQASLVEALRTVEPDEVYNLAAQSFVPTSWNQPVLTGEFTALGVTRMLEAIRQVDPADPLLPGLVERDVRQGPRGAADGGDAVPPAKPVRRGQGLRPLPDGQLPRVLRPLRRLRDPLQPRVAAARPGVRHPQGHGRRRPDQPGPRQRAADGQPGRPARLGLRRRLRPGDVADAPAGRAVRLRRRHGRRPLRCASCARSRSRASGSTTSGTSSSIRRSTDRPRSTTCSATPAVPGPISAGRRTSTSAARRDDGRRRRGAACSGRSRQVATRADARRAIGLSTGCGFSSPAPPGSSGRWLHR